MSSAAGSGADFTVHPLISAFVLIGCLLAPAMALGQEVRGRLLESGSQTPIPLGSVALLDSTFTSVAEAITNEAGAFLIRVPGPGSYYVLGESLGYEPKMDGVLELGPQASISIEFFLRPKPIELDSIVVALSRHRVYVNLNRVGYYDRLEQGFGSFVTPEEIERRNPRTTTDLLRAVPGIYMGQLSHAGTWVALRQKGAFCTPRVYINGMQSLNDPITEGESPGVMLEHLVDISDIAAVEVHTRATSIPLIYGGTQEGCGVILLWTHFASGKDL